MIRSTVGAAQTLTSNGFTTTATAAPDGNNDTTTGPAALNNQALTETANGVGYTTDLDAAFPANLGNYQFLSATRTFVSGPNVSFGRANGPDLIIGPISAVSGWEMLTHIGPASGIKRILQWQDPHDPVMTSGGRLIFDPEGGVGGSATFTAIPEPTRALLSLLGLGAVLVRRRR